MIGTHRAPQAGEGGTGDGAAQVVVGVGVAAGKLWAGEAENLFHPSGSHSLRQQVPGDPQIHDAPVGLRETFGDVPSLEATAIDRSGCQRSDAGWGSIRRDRAGAGSWDPGRRRQALADCSRVSACGAKPGWALTTFTQGA